ncbi:MAG: hypothetical protein RL217_1357 [Pseudomonadota bacterium]|jgi:large subunit ribosomal protein L29
MKANELKNKSTAELKTQLEELLNGQFKMRMQKATGQLNQTHLIRQTRRDIARVKTELASKAGK